MKGTFDFIVALFGLAVLSPVMLVIAVLLRTSVGRRCSFVSSDPGFAAFLFDW